MQPSSRTANAVLVVWNGKISHTFVPQPTNTPHTTVINACGNVTGGLGNRVASSGIHSVRGTKLAAMPAKKASVDFVGVEKRARILPEAPRVVPVKWRRREVD
jgi:hypothetical protein